MTIQEKLYEKLLQNFNDYIARLREMPPDNIIANSYEKTMREEILSHFAEPDYVSDEKALQMFAQNVDLDDLYNNYMKMDVSLRQMIEDSNDYFIQTLEGLPGQEIEGEKVAGYEIKRAILFENDRGFAFAHSPTAVSPYVTWQFTSEDGTFNDCYWGKYYGNEEDALANFVERAADYVSAYKVKEKQMSITAHNAEVLPDNTVSVAEMEAYGYNDNSAMLPLNAQRAEEMYYQGFVVFKLYSDGTEAEIENLRELQEHTKYDGLFGVESQDWLKSKEYQALKSGAEVDKVTPKNEIPVYKEYLDVAAAKGEKHIFVESQKLNHECGQAVDAAITANSKSGEMAGTQYVDTTQAARDVIAEYGAERVAWVIAGNVNVSANDGRWSSAAKDWAKGFDVPTNSVYHLNTHRSILNSFAENCRKLQLEAEQAAQAKEAAEKPWPIYKAELSDPNEPDRMEFIVAKDDKRAIEQAREFEKEPGVSLLELHEMDEDYNVIRIIDLEADPTLRRFMDVDLIDFLGKIADKVIVHYPADFKHDVEILWKKALLENPAEQKLMWHSSSYGTHMLDEEEVFTVGTGAWGYWVEYRPNEPDMVGYAIEVTGYHDTDETVIGNVYEVGDYAQHAAYVRQASLPFDSVSLTYANSWGINAGKTVIVPKQEYDKDRHRLMSESGDVVGIKYHPTESREITMAERLQSEQRKRMAMQIGDTEEHLQKIEARLAVIRSVPEQNQAQEAVAPTQHPLQQQAPQAQKIQESKSPQAAEKSNQAAEKAATPPKPKKTKKAYRGEDR